MEERDWIPNLRTWNEEELRLLKPHPAVRDQWVGKEEWVALLLILVTERQCYILWLTSALKADNIDIEGRLSANYITGPVTVDAATAGRYP